jgi:nickel/cobalt exporter
LRAEQIEPYIQLGSAVAVLMLALWMYLRTRRDLRQTAGHHHFGIRNGTN